jgi:hypothetical protein
MLLPDEAVDLEAWECAHHREPPLGSELHQPVHVEGQSQKARSTRSGTKKGDEILKQCRGTQPDTVRVYPGPHRAKGA